MDSQSDQPFETPPDFHTMPPSGALGNFYTTPKDQLTIEVIAKLQQEPEERTWIQTLIFLGISLFIFSASGLLNSTLSDFLLLVGVLLFHESGHYLGMRLFNYQDVKMFFIPFFGAAVSGRSTSVAGYKEAIVILLGPLPGIVLGLVLGTACMFHDEELVRSASKMLLIINLFNLLPFMPLDGGRLLHLVLFSRQRHLEAVFRVATGILLAACGWALGAWVLAGLGVFMALSTGHTFRVSTLAKKLRGQYAHDAEMNLSARIPPDQAVSLVGQVREKFSQLQQVKPLVNTVRQVWERMHIEPPGILASLALLGTYTFFLLATPLVFAVFQVPLDKVVTGIHADGSAGNVDEVRVWGQLRERTEMNAAHEPHGRAAEYSATGEITMEGAYKDGLPDGTWTFYGPDQVIEGRVKFEDGRLVKRTGKVPNYLADVPIDGAKKP